MRRKRTTSVATQRRRIEREMALIGSTIVKRDTNGYRAAEELVAAGAARIFDEIDWQYVRVRPTTPPRPSAPDRYRRADEATERTRRTTMRNRTEPSDETIEKLAEFFRLAEAYASLGDAVTSQLRAWAQVDFETDDADEGGVDAPTFGAMRWIDDRLGSQSDAIAELLDVDADEVASILRRR